MSRTESAACFKCGVEVQWFDDDTTPVCFPCAFALDGVTVGNCGTCQHANPDAYDDPTLVSCTHAKSFYHGRAMQATARCEKWEAK